MGGLCITSQNRLTKSACWSWSFSTQLQHTLGGASPMWESVMIWQGIPVLPLSTLLGRKPVLSPCFQANSRQLQLPIWPSKSPSRWRRSPGWANLLSSTIPSQGCRPFPDFIFPSHSTWIYKDHSYNFDCIKYLLSAFSWYSGRIVPFEDVCVCIYIYLYVCGMKWDPHPSILPSSTPLSNKVDQGGERSVHWKL